MESPTATLPAPPYFAVIFSSRRNGADEDGYADAATRMLDLAARQPGFLGVESARDAQGFGITVSYWASEADIAAWRAHVDHAQVRARGRRDWYRDFAVRIARVERAYGMDAMA